MNRWPLHLASFAVYLAAFWAAVAYYCRTGRNGVAFALITVLLGHAVLLFAVLVVRAFLRCPPAEWIFWWANVVMLQAAIAALIIFGRALRG